MKFEISILAVALLTATVGAIPAAAPTVMPGYTIIIKRWCYPLCCDTDNTCVGGQPCQVTGDIVSYCCNHSVLHVRSV